MTIDDWIILIGLPLSVIAGWALGFALAIWITRE